jgi:predicted NBD/HSP70 family sugar kinase
MNIKKVDSNDAKGMSRNRIYQLIYREGKISKPEISEKLGISMPTVMQNIETLKAEGLIFESGQSDSTGGRKATTFSCVPHARYSIGIDITLNHISGTLVNLNGQIIKNIRVKEKFKNSDDYYKNIGTMVDELIRQSGVGKDLVLGVGIVVPGVLSDDSQTMLNSYVLQTRDLRCRDAAKYISYPTIFCNDANAACIAEVWNMPDTRNCVYISLSNSVGGAILINNQLFQGENKRAGEFGHITIERSGKHCYCGKKGCLDVYCSASVLSDQASGDLENFFTLLNQKDLKISAIWADYVDYLATGVNILRAAFDCDVIIGGYVGFFMGEHIRELVETAASLNTFEKSADYIKPCKLKSDAAAIGGALLFIRPFVETI